MCRVLMPGDEESMSDEAIWETLPHFWVAISMVFLIAATIFLLLKLCGDVDALGWWDLFINFGEHHLELGIFQLLLSSCRCFFYKVQGYFSLSQDWWRRLFFCCILYQLTADIFQFLQEFTIALNSFIMVQGWWSIDEGNKEEQVWLFHAEANGYNTFSGYPPEVVKKMPKKDLAEEVWRLQAALVEQAEITKYTQEEYERLQNIML